MTKQYGEPAAYEAGKALPNLNNAVRMAEALGVTLDSLVREKEQT